MSAPKNVKYKYPAIDLIKLNNQWTDKEWNALLQKCERTSDLSKLVEVLYGISRGMDVLAKSGLNTEQACIFYAKLRRSIEVVVKRILRRKHPSVLDTNAKVNLNQVDAKNLRKELTNKRKRDLEFQKFVRDASF